jgi:hypothetical protein
MPSDIDDSFVQQFESEVHIEYQRMGSKLRNTVRMKNNIVGEQTTFQKIGNMTAGTKARNGQVPISNASHTPVPCTLTDYYSGDFLDKLDELKIQHDERSVLSTNIAAALGRKSDDLLIAQMDTVSTSNGYDTATPAAMSAALIQEGFETLGNKDVPMDDGQLYLAIGPTQWVDLMNDDDFSNADYVGADRLPLPGAMKAKDWMGIMVFPHTGLTLNGSSQRLCPLYHRTAFGHASGAEVSLDVTWQGKEQAHLFVGSMSQGACKIDAEGAFIILAT